MRFRSLALAMTALSVGLIDFSAIALPPRDQVPIPDPSPSPQPPPTDEEPPDQATRVPARLLTDAIEDSFSEIQLRLNNHKSNDSYVRLGSKELPFDIPEHTKDLDCGWECPDLGTAKFYLNDVNLKTLQVEQQNSKFQLSLAFEDNGREVKGYHTGSNISIGDNGIPDVQINDAQLAVSIEPLVANGQLTYEVTNMDFEGEIQATGPCDIGILGFDFDVCDTLFDYKDQLGNQIETEISGFLNRPDFRDRVASALTPQLENQGIHNVTGVRVEGNELAIKSQ